MSKIADRTSDKIANTLVSKSTIEARPEPTAVPFTSASPSFGCNSKNPPLIPASVKASTAARGSPLGPTAFELGLPVRSPAMSPDAVMVPLSGKQGVMLWLSSLVMASKISNLIPE
uniref:Uncharacterized protein n=1 Tax=Salix viminalis TaxID=40686 RepID=A0A6N2LQD3_SALVM